MGRMKAWGVYALIAAWAVACFAFFQWKYHYHFFYQEQNQLFLLSREYVASYLADTGWLSRLAGDFLTQWFYYLYAGSALLTGALLVAGDLVRRLLQRWGVERRWLSTVAALAVMTLFAVFSLHPHYRFSNVVALAGLAGTVLAGTLWWQLFSRRKRLSALRWAMPVGVVVGVWLFGCPQWGRLEKPNFYLERQLGADNEYYFGNYERLFDMVEKDPNPTQEMKFFYNLARARRGELPDYLLRFADTELGTFHRIGPKTPRLVINNMNELYWVLGDMTFCERAAMMNNVFSRDNRNVRMVKRLAETSLVSCDTVAARKYLRLLSQTLAYRQWAEDNLRQTDKSYVQKQAFVPRRDTITVTDNAHFLMVQLLDRNPQNTVALDYMLCSDLLLKDMDSFKRDYDRYCTAQPRLKRLYQEALCIWLAGSGAADEEWQRLIKMPDVARRFAQYCRQRGSRAFGDTYWYYFDKANAPQVE